MRTVEEQIIESLREVSGITSLTADSDFLALGLNSIKLVELAASLSETFQLNIEASDLFDNPSLQRLTVFIRQRKSGTVLPEQADFSLQEPVAIVSVAFRFPSASNFAELRELLLEGRIAIRKMPVERQELLGLDAKQSREQVGAYLDSIEMFDAESFGLGAAEAKYIDPQQRLLLELTSQCLLHSGLNIGNLKDRNIGVFIGVSGSEFERSLLEKGMEPRGVFATGTASSLAANRLSYVYDLHGPSCAFDSACSSSLVALHHACESLLRRECSQALVGGVNLLLSPLTSMTLAQAGMLSPDGCIRPFDDAAAGYVRGEGAAMLLMKPLAAAIKDKDPILGVIAGTAARHHGHSNGLAAPMPSKQAAVIREALGRSGMDPSHICYFETHGTGTRLGDQVEIAGITKAFADDPPESLAIGSIKANFGHLEACAGLAGLVKLLMIFQEGKIPPLAQYREPNARISWPAWLQVPKSVQKRTVQEHEGVCLASYGFGGMNAHIIMKRGPLQPAAAAQLQTPTHIFGIGASSTQRLDHARQALPMYLDRNKHIDLGVLAAHWNRAYSQGPIRESLLVQDHGSMHHHAASGDGRHKKLRLRMDSGQGPIDAYPENFLRLLPCLEKKTGELICRFMELWPDFLLILPSTPTDEIIESCKSSILAKLHRLGFLKSLQNYGFVWDDISADPDHILISLLLVDFFDYEAWLNLEILFQLVQLELLDQELFEEQLEIACSELTGESLSQKNLSWDLKPLHSGENRSDYETIREGLRSLYWADTPMPIESGPFFDPDSWHVCACFAETEESLISWLASLYSSKRFDLRLLANDHPRVFLALPDVSMKSRLWPEELSRTKAPVLQDLVSLDSDIDRVVEDLLLEILGDDSCEVSDEARMQSDLGMDSIHWFHLVSDVSQKLKVDIGRSDSFFILDQTLGEFKAMVRKLRLQPQQVSQPSCQHESASEQVKAYLSCDWVPHDDVEIIVVPQSFVHKHHEINVFVDSMLRFKKHPHIALALMKHHDKHPFFYEHPQDHIPGLYLAEAARQCAEAFIHSLGLDQHDTKFILKSSKNQFYSFCEQHRPVIMHIQCENAALGFAEAQDFNIRVDFYQGGLEKGFVEGHFTFMNSRIYTKIRHQPGRETPYASV